jgi:hypothetical protein
MLIHCVECHWNFGRDCIEHVDCFGSIAIFTMFILPIHEHGRSFHLLKCSLISSLIYSFQQFLWFLLLSLFHGTLLFFEAIKIVLFPWFFSQSVHC